MAQILKLLSKKDQKGLELLYDQYSGALFGIILRITNNHGLAEEILQQTFLNVWNNIQSFNEQRGSLYTWMATIARNKALDEVRLKRHENQNKTQTIDIPTVNRIVSHTDKHNIGADRILNILDDKYKEVLDMVYLRGFSQAEASKELNIPLGTIKSRIRIAIQKLRQALHSENELLMSASFLIIIILLWTWISRL